MVDAVLPVQRTQARTGQPEMVCGSTGSSSRIQPVDTDDVLFIQRCTGTGDHVGRHFDLFDSGDGRAADRLHVYYRSNGISPGLVLAVFAVMIGALILFTYKPPHIPLFYDETGRFYGIKCKRQINLYIKNAVSKNIF